MEELVDVGVFATPATVRGSPKQRVQQNSKFMYIMSLWIFYD